MPTVASGPLGRAITRIRNLARPNVVVTPPAGVLRELDVEVTVRDGVVLRVNVHRPAGPGRYPVIMSAHPYGKDYLPRPTRGGGYRPFPNLRVLPQSQRFSFSAWTGWEAPDLAYWVPRGYVVINADLRGWGRSDGVGNLFWPQEGEDYHDLIEWAAAQAHGIDDICLFAGVRKLRGGRPAPFENAYGFRGSLVTHGMRRASHPVRGADGTAPDDLAEPLRPGQVVTVVITLLPSATLFRAGEELQLVVRGRWFYPRNPFTGQFPAYYERSGRGRCGLHLGPERAAYLDLPVSPADVQAGGR